VEINGRGNAMPVGEKSWKPGQPRLDRSLTLRFIGDWGQANFHRICSWLCQEFCDRAGLRSRVGIWNTVGGGNDALAAVFDGEVDLSIATPAQALPDALTGKRMFEGKPMPSLRALGVLPQNDRMVLAVSGSTGIRSFEDIRRLRFPLRIATSVDDGVNFIGYAAQRFMEAHGIDRATLESWGGCYRESVRPEQSLYWMAEGEVDAVLQEAIMTPWWQQAVKQRDAVPIAAEWPALTKLQSEQGWRAADLPAGMLPGQNEPLPALDFSDFVIVVRDDMPEDVAHLLTWCLVETRETLERQFKHIPPQYSPLSYPLDPVQMARPSLPLHAGARRYYSDAGYLS
jgi:TRAP-type uncharacterized transport system substrate-binding protein